ncbi:Acyltransferase family protein [Halobacillus alkaliphilus]|uniref:Acyltransferase family protein n=1 Tax=Halobacillus alkaliphilus TaxID=396056 RepID=A0A1I2JX29_9BACI|nr:acyltransferase family protein [Halobacillus alkaliphilus]SFF58749.1 Acyltransferase family protein [Halobacillus alkaliphilus]
MIFFITVMKALAAILITNAHYSGVYPTDLIANGGLLGDVLFFAVAGFVLVNLKYSFSKWYWKRLIRVYPTIWIITLIYIGLGFYKFDGWSISEYFLFPTYYHFIASIVLLYVPYYLVINNKKLKNNIPLVMLVIFLIQIVIYVFFYDKSFYHIDTVREPMVRFLFFQSMLLGAYFRIKKSKYMNYNYYINWLLLLVLISLYFVSKLAFVHFEYMSPYQISNQIVLFFVLYYLFRCFSGIDSSLEMLPLKIKNSINFLAKITLEIYLVQYVIIPRLDHIVFPLNWVLITAIIIIAAYLLHIIGSKVSNILDVTRYDKLSRNVTGGAEY